MKLASKLIQAQKDFIKKNNCSICVNGIAINAGQIIKSKFKINVRYLCRKGLKFPKCRWVEFKIK